MIIINNVCLLRGAKNSSTNSNTTRSQGSCLQALLARSKLLASKQTHMCLTLVFGLRSDPVSARPTFVLGSGRAH